MKTTMNFVNKNGKDRNITSMTSGADGELMSVLRTKIRYRYMGKTVLVYDEETGHLRVGQGSKTEMESVSGVRVINSVSELPVNGRIDTLYICINDNSMYVWNADAKTWLPVGGGASGGGSSPKNPILVFSDRESFPPTGELNTLYITKQGESYIYDPANDKYIQLNGNTTDVYTKTESDDKYATKEELKDAIKSLDPGGGSSATEYSDVRDTFSVNSSDSSVTFTLSKTPVGEIDFYINGVHYVNTEAEENYTYNYDSNTLTWVNTDEESGGFTLEDSIVCIEYKTKD